MTNNQQELKAIAQSFGLEDAICFQEPPKPAPPPAQSKPTIRRSQLKDIKVMRSLSEDILTDIVQGKIEVANNYE